MLKTNLSPRTVASRIVLFSGIGLLLLIFAAAGTSAAGFSFLDSVKNYFGLSTNISNTESPHSTAAGPTSRIIPNDLPLNIYGTGWLRLNETSANHAPSLVAEAKPFFKPNNTEKPGKPQKSPITQSGITVGKSYHNDTSPPLREMRQLPLRAHEADDREGSEANKNPSNPKTHVDSEDKVVQSTMAPLAMPAPVMNFDGIPYPGVACNCAPPDTDGEVKEK